MPDIWPPANDPYRNLRRGNPWMEQPIPADYAQERTAQVVALHHARQARQAGPLLGLPADEQRAAEDLKQATDEFLAQLRPGAARPTVGVLVAQATLEWEESLRQRRAVVSEHCQIMLNDALLDRVRHFGWRFSGKRRNFYRPGTPDERSVEDVAKLCGIDAEELWKAVDSDIEF